MVNSLNLKGLQFASTNLDSSSELKILHENQPCLEEEKASRNIGGGFEQSLPRNGTLQVADRGLLEVRERDAPVGVLAREHALRRIWLCERAQRMSSQAVRTFVALVHER